MQEGKVILDSSDYDPFELFGALENWLLGLYVIPITERTPVLNWLSTLIGSNIPEKLSKIPKI